MGPSGCVCVCVCNRMQAVSDRLVVDFLFFVFLLCSVFVITSLLYSNRILLLLLLLL